MVATTYYTFTHLGGKWFCSEGMLRNPSLTLSLAILRWADHLPVVWDQHNQREVVGTVWVDGPAVQEWNASKPQAAPEKSGGSVNYYQVSITQPTTEGRPAYIAECNDIIEALGMDFAEGNQFKAIWRSCAERTLGKKKAGGDSVYDAEKSVFFSARTLIKRKAERACN